MMLLTIDPQTKTAGMLSIPRDMWVNIPDFEYNRINTAYSLGESWKLPGGGPGLAVRTVEEFLGVPIQYYAQVDFLTFERVIDELGGVRVTPFQTVSIDALGDGDIPVTVEAGVTVTLPGNLALAYARARHTEDGDIDRSKRQQEVIMGIRERVINYWPSLVPKIYPLYQEISSGINMNMTLEDALRLALLAREISLSEIKKGVIDYSMAVPITLNLPNGGGTADVLKPIPDQIRILRDEIFTSGGALSPMASGDPTQLMQAEGARVAVLNGSYSEGVAGKTSDYFKSQGMNVVLADNTSDKVAVTLLVDHSGKPYLLKYLMMVMNIDSSQVRTRFDPNASTDVDIIIGDDWAYNNPMP
jgi:LCP family protein required for cell wall assembly